MTRDPARSLLAREIARSVVEVPGVAFLNPGLTALLRPFEPRTADPALPSGVRVNGHHGAEPMRIDVRIVVLRHSRPADVARATRRAVGGVHCLAAPRGHRQAGAGQSDGHRQALSHRGEAADPRRQRSGGGEVIKR